MLKRFLIIPALVIATFGRLTADTAATVTESVNDVTHGASSSSQTAPAKVGTRLPDGEYLKTGVQSRAELQLANQTITRLGANTIFNYSIEGNEMDLQAGTILFSKPKDGAQLNIKSTAVTAAIVGTTGFMEVGSKIFLFGLVEGKGVLYEGAKVFHIEAGQILRIAQGGEPQVFYFDIPKFLKTSPLVAKFHGRLPNQAYIDREVVLYNDFADRGFIAPPTIPIGVTEVEADIPVLPLSSNDSAANSLKQFNESRLPAPPQKPDNYVQVQQQPPPPPNPPPQLPSNPFVSNGG